MRGASSLGDCGGPIVDRGAREGDLKGDEGWDLGSPQHEMAMGIM